MSDGKFSNNIEGKSFAGHVLMIAKVAIAIFLVNLSVILIMAWMALAIIAFFPSAGLMPWVSSGILLFGLFFIICAAIPGVPGIVMCRSLIRNIGLPLREGVKVMVLVGEVSFKVGSIFAILALIYAMLK